MQQKHVIHSIIFILFFVTVSCSQKYPLIHKDDGLFHPGLIYGRLANGFQYILMQNNTPEDRVNMHLNVFAGSMHETEDQQGVAHYLEHMLFNGSEHYKPGELIDYFQTIGMDFGADANAHTSFFNTIYDLSLPRGDEKQIKEALVIVKDYAKGALLLKSEVDKERGIILAEKRERDSVSHRTFKKTLEFELPGSLFNRRFPIGIERTLKAVSQRSLKAYYDQWYRPDNMVLVVVGDFKPSQVEPLIKRYLSTLSPRTVFKKGHGYVFWEEHLGNKAFYHHEPESGSTEVTIETISYTSFENETVEDIKQKTLDRLANTILQHRLSRMVSTQRGDFTEASAYSGKFLRHLSASVINASCKPENWESVLLQLENTLRQCLKYGFTPKELERVKNEFTASLEKRVNQSNARKSSDLAKEILRKINQKELLLSPEQRLSLLKPFIASVRIQDVNQAIQTAWSKKHRLIIVTGNARILSENPVEFILNVYNKGQAVSVNPYTDFKSGYFPYLETPKLQTGKIPVSEQIDELDISTIKLKNNIRINLKQTDFKPNQFLFKVCFGEGKRAEPRNFPGISLISESVINLSGLGKLDLDQFEEVLSDKKIRIKFGINENHFQFSGSCVPLESELLFQLIYHYLRDPGFRKEAVQLYKTRYSQQFENLLRTTDGIIQIKGNAFLGGYDHRFGLPPPLTIEKYTLEDIDNWLRPNFDSAPMEISIVGDFDRDTILSYAFQYLGALKKRENFSSGTGYSEKIIFPKGQTLDLKMDTKIQSGTIRVAFLTDDFWDIHQTRRLSILARIFSERLRLVLREALGQAYSPYVYNDASIRFKNYGILHVVVNIDSKNINLAYEKIKRITNDILENGISDKAVKIALNPVLTHLKVIRKTNDYWLNSVMANSFRYPVKLEWAKTMIDSYETVNKKDMEKLSKKFLRIGDSALITIRPEDIDDSLR